MVEPKILADRFWSALIAITFASERWARGTELERLALGRAEADAEPNIVRLADALERGEISAADVRRPAKIDAAEAHSLLGGTASIIESPVIVQAVRRVDAILMRDEAFARDRRNVVESYDAA